MQCTSIARGADIGLHWAVSLDVNCEMMEPSQLCSVSPSFGRLVTRYSTHI